MSKPQSVKISPPGPVVRQAPLIPPAIPVKPIRVVIEIEHGAVDAVYSSDQGVKIEILDRDAMGVGNIRPKDAPSVENMHQVY